jgi:hypothetical protein
VPLVLRGKLYLIVEAKMKKEYKLVIENDTDLLEENENLSDMAIEQVWLDTGDVVVKLPKEILRYLQEAETLGIA